MSYASNYSPDDGVAIVGMVGRFPGADGVRQLWGNLAAGLESISRFTAEELEPGSPEEMAARGEPGYVPARGIIPGVDLFDAAFFGIPPAEAAVLDPQQRLFLEACWEALEDAGHDPQSIPQARSACSPG